jgi:hypothetical protein
MVTESFFSLACAGLIGLAFGTIFAFAGYRFFLVLLPIWGFIFGLAFGAQTVQALFGTAFLATITSWVIGFIVGAVFAVLSYLFWIVAVALLAGELGYAIATGILLAIGLQMGYLVWLIGIIAGVALAIVVIAFNLQKWLVIVATSILGAATIVGTLELLFNPAAQLVQNPISTALRTSPLLAILFVVIAIIGIVVQFASTRTMTIVEYNRWSSEAEAM